MELREYIEDDYWLTEALESDPEVMSELGGPNSPESMREAHAKRLASALKVGWWLVIVPEPGSPGVGTIGIWESEWQGEKVHEAGWMVLPAHQGKGNAGAALEILLGMARDDPSFTLVHAFPGASNEPSNGLCKKLGFEFIEAAEITYRERSLSCNHWAIPVD